jgi:hypothetical protein
MNFSQLGNAFEIEKSMKLDHKALGFHSLKQLLTSPQFLGLVDIEHPSNNVAIMYPTTKDAVATRKRKKMGSHLETFALKAKDNMQSRTIPDFSDLPSSSMSNPFSNAKNRKKKK